MTRPMILLAAMASAALAVTSACLAEARNSDRPFRPDGIHFSLTNAKEAGKFRLELRQPDRRNQMTSDFAPAELGLAASALVRGGTIAPKLVRDAGRIDCSGEVRARVAQGACRFTPDEAFLASLGRNVTRRPTLEESYGMTIVGLSRPLVDAIGRAGYGPASPDDLIALAAVGVTPAYVQDLAGRGYRPSSLDDLVAFRAVGVTPAYVDGLMKSGLAKPDGETIVAMRALDIDPEFIAGFARIGYRDIDPDQLVAMKALGVTPAMVRALEQDRKAVPIAQRAVAEDLIRSKRR